MNPVLLGILLYIGAQLLIGLLVSRRIRSEEDYLLAGRRFGYLMATFSFFATWFGAETCIGAASRIYAHGLSGASADPFGYGVCLLLMGCVFAKPLHRRGLTTLADLFHQRFSPAVERFAVLLMVPTSVLWAAAQIRGFGHVLDVSSGIGSTGAITLAASVVILYTTSGGMQADVVTDLIQGLALIAGLVLLPAAIFPEWTAVQSAWQSIEPERLRLFDGSRPLLETIEAWAVPICGSVVAQELVARALASRSPEVASRSAFTGGTLYIAVGGIPVFLGLVGPQLIPHLDDPEQFLPVLARQHLATAAYVLFAGALVSAILSTVDSTLLAAASLTSHNLIIPLFRGLGESGKLRMSRLGVVIFGALAWWLALRAETIFDLVESASAFGSAGILTIVVFGLFTRFGGAWSGWASLTTGVAVWIGGNWLAWPYVYLLSLTASFISYVVAGVIEGIWGERGAVCQGAIAENVDGDLG